MKVTEQVIKLTGQESGPAVAIFAGTHGDELAGVLALQKVLPSLKLKAGSLFVAYGNPPAIAANERMLTKNLNRCFYTSNSGRTYEDIRARELMQVLDQCEALLDLHMFYGDDGEPFVICEDNAIPIADKFDVGIISTNWSITEPGAADGYMSGQGKVGICVECGPISKVGEYQAFAERTILQFLAHYKMIDSIVPESKSKKRHIRADYPLYKSSPEFRLSPGFQNFDMLKAGQVIASDTSHKIRAREGECIIFPHYNARIGEEACVVGLEISS